MSVRYNALQSLGEPFIQWLDGLLKAYPTVSICVAALWSGWIYVSGSRVNAASLISRLEEEYERKEKVDYPSKGEMSIRELCEDLENDKIYDQYRDVLQRWAKAKAEPPGNTQAMSKGLRNIDRIMRFYLRCAHFRWFGYGSRTIDSLHRYYVTRYVCNKDGNRSELQEYVQGRWLSVSRWGYVIDKPLPIRGIMWCFFVVVGMLWAVIETFAVLWSGVNGGWRRLRDIRARGELSAVSPGY
jgi:hypothetical protein